MKIEDVSTIWEKILKVSKKQDGRVTETDYLKLMESVLLSTQDLMHCDGAALFYLENEILICHAYYIAGMEMKYHFNEDENKEKIPFAHRSLHLANKEENQHDLVAHTVLNDKSICINDIYENKEFDFREWIELDAMMKYVTKSLFSVPLRNHQDEIIGVLLFHNFLNIKKEPAPFPQEYLKWSAMVSHLAGMTLSNYYLTNDMARMFESLVKVLASAIDEKSAYTGGHCRRVPIIALMLAEAMAQIDKGPFKDFQMNDMDRYILELAALLHDCGKIVTPVHIMDKATKLETIYDRIDLIKTRFEILLRDNEIAYLKELRKLESTHASSKEVVFLHERYQQQVQQIKKDFKALQESNRGEEQMDPSLREQVFRIAQKYRIKNWDDDEVSVLTGDEIKNLSVVHGTLTAEERSIINYHANISVKMLEEIHFPKHLRRIPEIAGNHHEHMDGTGYPRGLKKLEMSVMARLMGVVDVFEALTAKDRPYKRGKKLSEALFIMGKMVESNQIDGDIFRVFIDQEVYLKYAEEYLDSGQIDSVNLVTLPGYGKSQKIKKVA